MTISEVIAVLERVRGQVGDVQLKVNDGNENFDLKPKSIRAETEDAPEADPGPFGNGLVLVAVLDLTV